MNFPEKLEAFRALVEKHQQEEHARKYPSLKPPVARTHVGKKWARVDVDSCGKYMVEMTTEEIVGIKAYGVPHPGHRYGTLDTIHLWNWGGWKAVPF